MMRPASRQGERGQALVIIAASFVVLIILGTLVFDVGLATSDRRNLQAYADAAALGGARSYTAVSTQAAHYTAMQYLAGPLGFTLPQGGCTSSAACPVGTYTLTPYTIQLADSSLPGWAYPSVLDVVITHQQTSIFGNILGFASVSVGTSARAAKPGPQTTPALYSVAAVAGDVSVNGGGNGVQTATGAVYAFGSLGANNGPHSMGIPRVTTNYDGSACAGSPTNEADFGGNTTNGLTWHWEPNGSATTVTNKAAPTTFDSLGPTTNGPTYTTVASAKDASGHWKPGIYSGIVPNGGTMNGGVYKIINVANPNFGTITNTVHTASGSDNGANAVAIVLDSSDTGSLGIANAVLNGIDDLQSPNSLSTRDPAATRNFVLYGGNGAGAFAGSIDIGPGATTDLSGIIYLPKVTYSDHGNTTINFTGSTTFKSISSSGTATIRFNWVCGLTSAAAIGNGRGLIR